MILRFWLLTESFVFYAFLLALPSYIDNGILSAARIPKFLLITWISCGLLLSWALRRCFWRGEFRPSLVPITYLLLAGYLVFQWYCAAESSFALRALLTYLPSFVLGLYVFAHYRTKEAQQRILVCVVLASLPTVIYAILQSYGIDFINWKQSIEQRDRIGAFLGNPSYVGDYLAIMAVIAFGFFRLSSRTRVKFPVWAYLLLAAFAILRTQSRGPWLLVMFGVVCLLLSDRKHRSLLRKIQLRKIVKTACIALVILLVAAGVLSRVSDVRILLERVREGFLLYGSSGQMRLTLWDVSRRMWTDHFWLGMGLHQFRVHYLDALYNYLSTQDTSQFYRSFLAKTNVVHADYVHNDYLQVLAEWGSCGYGLLLLLVVGSVFCAYQRIRSLNDDVSDQAEKTIIKVTLAALSCLMLDAGYAFPLQLPTTIALFFVLLGTVAAGVPWETKAGGDCRAFGTWRSSRILSLIVLLAMLWPIAQVLKVSLNTYRGERCRFGAMEARMRGDRDAQLKLLQEAFYHLPEHGELYFDIANFRFQQGQMIEAREYYDLARKTFDNPSLCVNRAWVAIETRHYQEAEELLKKIKTIAPNHPQVYYLRGFQHYLLGEFDKAVDEFQSELAHNADDINSNLYLGESLVHLKRYTEAERYFKRAAEVNPRNMAAHENLGDLYAEHLDLPKQAAVEYALALGVAEQTGNRNATARIQDKRNKLPDR